MATDLIRKAFAPSTFEKNGGELIQKLTAYFSETLSGKAKPLQWAFPDELVTQAEALLKNGAGAHAFGAIADKILHYCHRFHSPRDMGHQIAPAIPDAGLFDALASITNQGGALFEGSPFLLAAERALIGRLGGLVGWREGEFDGIGTSGGTIANLTAILTARNLRYGEAWEGGLAALGKRPALIAAEDAHYSVSRAAGILGLGARQVLKAPVDAARRLTPAAVEPLLDKAVAEGLDVFCLVAAAGSTPSGAYDDLEGLAELAAARGLWFHVDGAHGASALFSRRHAGLMKGVERADSLVWDAHKMLFVPSLSTFLLYRDRIDSFAAFKQDAPYLFDPEAPALSAYDGALRTVECTKHCLSAALFGAWAVHGPRLFEDLVDTAFANAARFHALLADTPDFTPLHQPQANILCFRYLPPALGNAAPEAVSSYQLKIRRRLVQEGSFYITSTRWDGVMALRVTLMNPFTDAGHLTALMERIREIGRSQELD